MSIELLQLVKDEFPLEIALKDGKILDRDVFIIDNDSKVDDKLIKLIKILDENLGNVYKTKSKNIYGNSLPWEENKMVEMKSNELIYITYSYQDKIELYLSIMYTYENGLIIEDLSIEMPVIYLYEIQIRQEYRQMGIGKLLMNHLIKIANDNNDKIYAIELTVFSNNDNAINFYKKLSFIKTFDSPIDKTITITPRITRSKPMIKEPIKIIKRRPDYYLMFHKTESRGKEGQWIQ